MKKKSELEETKLEAVHCTVRQIKHNFGVHFFEREPNSAHSLCAQLRNAPTTFDIKVGAS